MSKKVIIIVVSLILIGGAFWYYLASKNATNSSSASTGTKSFLPFGDQSSGTNGQQSNASTPAENTINENGVSVTVKLNQVTPFSIAGFTLFNDTRPTQDPSVINTNTVPSGANSVPALRYVARADGHVYEEYLDTGASAPISTSTIPSVHEALFGNNGKSVIYRYLDPTNDSIIQSYVGTLGDAIGSFLSTNINNVSISPDGSQYFYLINNGNVAVGLIGSFGNTKRAQVFSSPFTEWMPQWTTKSTILLTTKPSWNVVGSVYSLNTSTQNITKVFGGINGLTTLASPSATAILYAQDTSLGVYDVANKSFSNLSSATLPEKCVWSSDNINIYCGVPDNIIGTQYPDLWYQGVDSFDDSIVEINTATGGATTLIDTGSSTPIDATHLMLSTDEKTLFMINKKDSTLWSLSLS